MTRQFLCNFHLKVQLQKLLAELQTILSVLFSAFEWVNPCHLGCSLLVLFLHLQLLLKENR